MMEVFVCSELNVRLTAHACAKNHTLHKSPRSVSSKSSPSHMLRCSTCAVGAWHSAGKAPQAWPDGRPIVRLTVLPAVPMETLKRPPVVIAEVPGPLVPAHELEKRRRGRIEAGLKAMRAKQRRKAKRRKPSAARKSSGARGALHPFRGKMLSAAELTKTQDAVERGIAFNVVANRLNRGWSAEEAVTTPPGKRLYPTNAKKIYPYKGKMLSAMEVCRLPEAAHLRTRCVQGRLTMGWTVERTISEPAGARAERTKGKKTYPFRGQDLTLFQLLDTPEARSRQLCAKTLFSRLSTLGWSAEEAVTTDRGPQANGRAVYRQAVEVT